ncbi:MAG: ChrR family anti-sigma-E factor [Hyphomonadaceae bacterium JAD_PAG50586_4]|nr:MAG: ChrR family anti-sigma-E factor [Hyphomonadaceae bacterium JAD_PAG50586_4]
MSGQHHPCADILAAYASGLLEPGFGLVVAAHVEGCAHCRAQVVRFEAHSGAALRDLDGASLGEDALSRVMARLDDAPAPDLALDRRPLMERLSLKPRKWVAPGVWVAAVETPHARTNRVYVLSVAPGMPTARHEHSGAEFCTVLKGAYRDELGLFRAGDFASADHDVNHQPVVQGDEACVCLFATEGRLQPQGLLGRLAFAYADV